MHACDGRLEHDRTDHPDLSPGPLPHVRPRLTVLLRTTAIDNGNVEAIVVAHKKIHAKHTQRPCRSHSRNMPPFENDDVVLTGLYGLSISDDDHQADSIAVPLTGVDVKVGRARSKRVSIMPTREKMSPHFATALSFV